MSDKFSCHDKNSLIAYLYDEVEPPLRREIDDHLRSCVACTDELASLSAVRVGLSAWAPPEPALGITIAPGEDVARPSSWWAEVPVWAQVAAAVFVLAVGLGVANVQVRSGADGLVVTTGWMTPSVAPAAANPATDERWRPALAALESQLRGEIQANRSPASSPVAQTTRTADDATLRQVQAMLVASEERQRQELAFRLTQLTRDIDVQRRADLVRISQGFGQFEGRTGEMMARQRQMMNYITRVSGQPQQ
jgi:anti-sigma factor RsiW